MQPETPEAFRELLSAVWEVNWREICPDLVEAIKKRNMPLASKGDLEVCLSDAHITPQNANKLRTENCPYPVVTGGEYPNIFIIVRFQDENHNRQQSLKDTAKSFITIMSDGKKVIDVVLSKYIRTGANSYGIQRAKTTVEFVVDLINGKGGGVVA